MAMRGGSSTRSLSSGPSGEAPSCRELRVSTFDLDFGRGEKSAEETKRLVNEHWPDEEKRKEFFKGYSKIFDGHGDYLYTNVPELAK